MAINEFNAMHSNINGDAEISCHGIMICTGIPLSTGKANHAGRRSECIVSRNVNIGVTKLQVLP